MVRSLQVKCYLLVPKYSSVLLCSLFLTMKMKDGRKQSKKYVCATANLVRSCSPLAQPPISLSWTSLLTAKAEGYVGHILLLVQPSLLTSQSQSSLYARPCDGNTLKGAQHREHAWEHCQALLGPVALEKSDLLANTAIADVTPTCPQNFHYWAHALQYHAKFVGKIFLALKNRFQSCWFPFAAPPKKACPGSIYFQVKRQLS